MIAIRMWIQNCGMNCLADALTKCNNYEICRERSTNVLKSNYKKLIYF